MLTPRPRGPSVWAYTSNLGGGMVAGDSAKIELAVDSDALCFIGTQASSKIYRNRAGQPCSHELLATVGANATLVFAPDAVQCFADAIYHQNQTFHLASGGNLILVDWISAGRLACGERWSFTRYYSRNMIFLNGRPLVIDAVDLGQRIGPVEGHFRVGRFNCLGFVCILGPAFADHSLSLFKQISEQPVASAASLLCSASPVSDGILLRFAGMSVEEVGRAIYDRLKFVSTLLQDNPWTRKW